jgi:caa(3)-type oxidase subunit IV
MSDTAHAEHPSVKHYIRIFVLLAVLTAVELAVVLFKLPKTWLVLALVALAAWKAVLVALHFMHLKMDPRRLSLTVIAPVVALLIFVLIISFESLVKHHIPFTDRLPPPAAAQHGE